MIPNVREKRKKISPQMRQVVLDKYGGHCAYCGKEIDLKSLRVDHIEPFYLGGKDELANFNPSCCDCNFYKSTFSVEDFRKNLMSLHERIMKPFISRLGADYGIVQIKPFDGQFYFEKEMTNDTEV